MTTIGHGPQLTAHEALSGVFGSISLASWIFLLVSSCISILPTRTHTGCACMHVRAIGCDSGTRARHHLISPTTHSQIIP